MDKEDQQKNAVIITYHALNTFRCNRMEAYEEFGGGSWWHGSQSNDCKAKAMRDGQGSPPKQWKKSDTPLRPRSHYGKNHDDGNVYGDGKKTRWIGHTQTFPFFIMLSNLLQTSFSLYNSGLLSSSETYTFRRVVAMASFFSLVIIIPLNSWPRDDYFLSVSESHLALGFLSLVAIAHFFACADPKRHLRLPSPWTSPWQPLSCEGHVHVRVTKRVVWPIKHHRRRHFCRSVTGTLPTTLPNWLTDFLIVYVYVCVYLSLGAWKSSLEAKGCPS